MSIINLTSKDPFSDIEKEEKDPIEGPAVPVKKGPSVVHIHMKQRKSRKYVTIVKGINPRFDFSLILKEFKKKSGCNGVVMEKNNDAGEMWKEIHLQGDHRFSMKAFLLENGLAKKERIKVHGG
ncbi:Eukaryotic translation initiation factor SUI1 like protein [Aduncisulcus paluster]|uniref:Eukaryotic translation initiation factor SUI1 like protein n=1 Tax=Aduncisulcus paluster TaxID=2918883 RepID=A0ABQ5KZZ5_9EUKA|nr:Eukaryotic translation initiation factor SUI1 like protein [Aduncisulcus paluster]